MNADKKIIIDELLEQLNSSPFVLVVEYGGLTVGQFGELRNRLSDVKAACSVAKNTYVKRAASEAKLPEGLAEFLAGQTAIITGESDVAAAAKVLKNFNAEFGKPEIKAGTLDGTLLDEAGVRAIADLPSREQLLAKLLGLFNQPATMLARILNEPGTALARVLKAKAEQD